MDSTASGRQRSSLLVEVRAGAGGGVMHLWGTVEGTAAGNNVFDIVEDTTASRFEEFGGGKDGVAAKRRHRAADPTSNEGGRNSGGAG